MNDSIRNPGLAPNNNGGHEVPDSPANLPNPPIGVSTASALVTSVPLIVGGVIAMINGNTTEGVSALATGGAILFAMIIGRSQQAKGIYENYVDPTVDEFQDAYKQQITQTPGGGFDEPGTDVGQTTDPSAPGNS